MSQEFEGVLGQRGGVPANLVDFRGSRANSVAVHTNFRFRGSGRGDLVATPGLFLRRSRRSYGSG